MWCFISITDLLALKNNYWIKITPKGIVFTSFRIHVLKKHNYYTPANSFSSTFFSDTLCLFIVVCSFFPVCIDSTNELFLCYSNVGNVFSFVLKYLNAYHVNTHKMQCILYLLLSKTLSFSFFTCIQPYFVLSSISVTLMNVFKSNEVKKKLLTIQLLSLSGWRALAGCSGLCFYVRLPSIDFCG